VPDKIIVFELKLDKTADEAMDQIKTKGCYEMFNDRKVPVYLVGINFDGEKRTLDKWLIEAIS